MADIVKKLLRQQVTVIKKAEKIRGRDMDRIAEFIEIIETGPDSAAYAAGYLRGVAETNDVTLREMLEDL